MSTCIFHMHRTTAHTIVKLQLSGSTRAPLYHATLYNELLCYHSRAAKNIIQHKKFLEHHTQSNKILLPLLPKIHVVAVVNSISSSKTLRVS